MGRPAESSDPRHRVLVVHSDAETSANLREVLSRSGFAPGAASTLAAAELALESEPYSVALVGLTLPDGDGVDFLERLRDRHPETSVVMLADRDAAVPRAVDAMKAGAADFLVEPVAPEALAYVVGKAVRVATHDEEEAPRSVRSRTMMVGTSPGMREVDRLLRRAAPGAATVLIRGESGTGKEMVARAVHELSTRRDQPFVKLHCGALPDTLLESELFGYERGAFTGATSRKPGRFELANHGTLFLDEIGDVTPATQVKLLRVLQEREIERLGGVETIKLDVRFIAATHRDLEGMVLRGEFREDLFYRLNVVPVWLPPLRTRREDIEPLARHFCAELARANGKAGLSFDEEAMRALRRERWPGNVRQLQNVIERLVVLSSGSVITAADVEQDLGREVAFVTQAPSVRPSDPAFLDPATLAGELDNARAVAERAALVGALERAAGNRTLAAKILGISRRTLYNKLDEHGL